MTQGENVEVIWLGEGGCVNLCWYIIIQKTSNLVVQYKDMKGIWWNYISSKGG